MKNIKGYVNTKTDLELIRLNIKSISLKEEYLKKEKQELEKLEKNLSDLLNTIKEKLSELKGIEKELLYEIVINGKNVTRAVDIVAFTYDLDVSTIWKSYYPKVKAILKELKII